MEYTAGRRVSAVTGRRVAANVHWNRKGYLLQPLIAWSPENGRVSRLANFTKNPSKVRNPYRLVPVLADRTVKVSLTAKFIPQLIGGAA